MAIMKNFIDLTLECNGQSLHFGMASDGTKREFGITKIQGLEASEFEITTTDNALTDGSTVDGKRIKNRPIHIEATLRDERNNPTDRQRIIKFFNPKYSGTLTVNYSGVERTIGYELEGWAFVAQRYVGNKLSITVDLICPEPFLKNIDNFGKNMASKTSLFAFPWRVLKEKKAGIHDPYKGLGLAGMTSGYLTLNKEVLLVNDGDVPCGIQVKFVASRGEVVGPKILHIGTGKYMHINLTMQEGDTLLIDTETRHQIIELNGKNVYQHIDRLSEPFQLDVGDNFLEYDADENYTNLDVMLYYTPMYLGV